MPRHDLCSLLLEVDEGIEPSCATDLITLSPNRPKIRGEFITKTVYFNSKGLGNLANIELLKCSSKRYVREGVAVGPEGHDCYYVLHPQSCLWNRLYFKYENCVPKP